MAPVFGWSGGNTAPVLLGTGDPVEKVSGEFVTSGAVCGAVIGAVVTEEVVSGTVVVAEGAPSGATS